MLWPALPAALARDAGTSAGERVTTTAAVHTIPLNADVASVAAQLAAEIPTVAAWAATVTGQTAPGYGRSIPGHLRHLATQYEYMLAQRHARDAGRLAGHIGQWHHDLRNALGLNRPDRPLRTHCPQHDDPLTVLVEPGDRGWLRYRHLDHAGRPVDPWVSWQRTEAIVCRHCGATWAPGRYLWLGRLIRDADQRRAHTAAGGPDNGEAA